MTNPKTTSIWFLRNTPLFEDQSESMYESLGSKCQMIEFQRGDLLPTVEAGRSVIYVLSAGQVKLRFFNEAGKEIILDVLGEQDVFGPLEQVVEEPATPRARELHAPSAEAVAVSAGSAFKYDLDYFNDLVQRRPTLMVNVSRILGLRRKQLEFRIGRMLYRSSLGKVAGMLSELGERYGKKEGEQVELDLGLTHQEMASIVGLKRETVSEALAELEYRGLITAGRGRVTIVDGAGLDKVQ
jgi:CRP-like cAMP-binding protein